MFDSKPPHDQLPLQRFWGTSNRRILFLVTLSALLCFLFTFRNSSPVACQEIHSGLPSASDPISPYIRRVFQDVQGNYWIGTNEDGVARYNGGSLQYFTNRDGLAGNAVRAILQDSTGALWFATDGGVSRWYDGSFTNYTTKQGLLDNDCWAMVQDPSGTLWVGTRLGLCRLENQSFVSVDLPVSDAEASPSRSPSPLIWSLLVDQQGKLWVGTDGAGVYQFDGNRFTSMTTRQGLAGNHVACLFQDRKGCMWFGFVEGGVSSYDGTTIQSYGKSDGLPEGWSWTLLDDNNGDLLLSVLGTGLVRLDENRFRPIEIDHVVLPKHVQSLYRDRQGLLWMGCSGGLFRQSNNKVIHITKDGPWPERKASAIEPSPAMKPFERLVGKSWKVTASSGRSMIHTWGWGPGGHSVERWTEGEGAQGAPWKELIVFYEDPNLQTTQLLGISPYDSGISKGSITFDGSQATSTIQLAQSRGNRSMQTVWQFINTDEYSEKLLERDAKGNWTELVEFRHQRISELPTVDHSPLVKTVPELPTHWKPYQQLLSTWMGTVKPSGHVPWEATMQWIPHANFLYGQVFHSAEQQATQPWINIYLYRDTPSSTLRGLVLVEDGEYYQGVVETTPDGALQFVQTKQGTAMDSALRVQLSPQANGQIEQKLWLPHMKSPSSPLEILLRPSSSIRR